MIILQKHVIGIYLERALSQNKQLIYMITTLGYKVRQDKRVCKILKSLYGLK